MDEKNLPSSSDESDADFVPKEEENSDSGSEVSDYDGSEEENNSSIGRKRKKRGKKAGKKAKTSKSEEEEEEEEHNEAAEEKQEIDVDALWADFKKDVNDLETKKTAECSQPSSQTENLNSKSSKDSAPTPQSTNKPRSGFSLPNKSKGGGLSNVLNQIGKKDKMSTLQKSQLDWNNFKKSEGIDEEIKMYNRGKDGYLEKQDFLQRTDLRQFEIEKDLRSARRKF